MSQIYIVLTDVINSLLFKSESPLGQSLVKTRKRKIPFLSGFVVRQIVSKHFEYFLNLYF